MNKEQEKALLEFDSYFTDCGFVEPNTHPETFNLRGALKKLKELGRPLTAEEMAEFEVREPKK